MLTQEDDVEIHALAARGWSKAVIARRTGRDRKTVRKYLDLSGGEQRERPPSCLEPFRGYLETRFVEDPDVDATVLYRELVEAGFDRSYPTLFGRSAGWSSDRSAWSASTTGVRTRRSRSSIRLGRRSSGTGLSCTTPRGASLGALSHSGRFRAVFREQMTFGHLADAAHRVLVGLGGTARVLRTDRMAMIVTPGTDRLTVDAANLAQHYGVEIRVCPPRPSPRC